MALKYAAKGAVITVGGTAIDGVQSLSVPSDSVNLIDVSSHDSPSGRHEYVPGMVDSDDLTFDIIYDSADANHEALRVAPGSAALAFVISLANGTTNDVHTFSAFVTGFSISLAFDGAETATVTLKRSGADAVTDSV